MTDDLPFHPFADLFPLIEGLCFRELVEDISVHGLREPVVLFEGAILDGRNRYRACRAAQVPVRLKQYDGKDALAFVVSVNLHRRHLDVSQRSMIAARISQRQKGGRAGPSSKVGAKLAMRPRPERYKSVVPAGGIAQKDAATLMNISAASVTHARKVLEAGIPALVGAVDRGEISANAAATIASFGAQSQEQILRSGSKTVTILARECSAVRSKRESKTREGSFALLRAGDGRLVSGIPAREIADIIASLRLSARVLELVHHHVANAEGGQRVRDLVTEARFEQFFEEARAEVQAAIAQNGNARS